MKTAKQNTILILLIVLTAVFCGGFIKVDRLDLDAIDVIVDDEGFNVRY